MHSADPIALEILWGRLTAIVDEVAASMVRTAFSTILQETNDFAVVLTDDQGRLVVQNTMTIPVFIATIPMTIRYALQQLPVELWKPGDVMITNDPYIATGHKNDLTIITPVFQGGRLVAFMGNAAHSADIGGVLLGAASRETFEEGIQVPLLKLYDAGQPNAVLHSMIRANVRVPEHVIGDIESQVVSNAIGARRLQELMEDMELVELQSVAAALQDRAEQAMREAIRGLPDGTYRYDRVRLDGLEDPLVICARVEVLGDEILVDYEGTSPQQSYAVNSAMPYTYAYTVYPLKCLLSPDLPNNDGAIRPIKVKAPPGSLLNPMPPAPLAGRALTGHAVVASVFGAMRALLPDRVLAESGTPVYIAVLAGVNQHGRPFAITLFANGGQGAQAAQDGVSALSFPANVGNTPAEILAHQAPVEFLERELVPGSGGAGRSRGGLAQRVRFRIIGVLPITLSLLVERLKFAPLGMARGYPGRSGRVRIEPARPVNPKGHMLLRPGDIFTIETPGGGGFGDPCARDDAIRVHDVREGYCLSWPSAPCADPDPDEEP